MVRIVSNSIVILVALWTATGAAKKNRDLPHPHSGILKAYEAGPFQDLKLDKNDEKELASGKSVMKHTIPKPGELGGGAICVQDIDAPKEAVWAQILDLDSYKGKVPKVNESKNYVVRTNPDGTTTVKTKMVLGVIPGYSVRLAKHFRWSGTEMLKARGETIYIYTPYSRSFHFLCLST